MVKNKNKKNLNIISISLPEKISQDMDTAVDAMGYMSRSELIRDALREFLKDNVQIERIKGTVEGVVTLLYSHDYADKISEVRHRNTNIFRSFMHSDFDIDECSCCEVLMFSGNAKDVRKAYFELKAIKGVDEAHIYIASKQ
ncbi:MAG: CopG family ribbon-helix-helix protein [Thermoplasmata archaeon]|nr:MAG: CopG family ribbon-helix-helix protein [Thermoplasmata archaeon]